MNKKFSILFRTSFEPISMKVNIELEKIIGNVLDKNKLLNLATKNMTF